MNKFDYFTFVFALKLFIINNIDIYNLLVFICVNYWLKNIFILWDTVVLCIDNYCWKLKQKRKCNTSFFFGKISLKLLSFDVFIYLWFFFLSFQCLCLFTSLLCFITQLFLLVLIFRILFSRCKISLAFHATISFLWIILWTEN